MAIKIKSAVLSASSLNVEYEEIVATPDSVVTHDFKQKRGTLIHEDLANAINALKPHFAMLCEFREVKPDPIEIGVEYISSWDFGELLDKVFVSGFKINYSTSGESLTIIGGKYTKHSVINLSAPSVSSDSVQYPYVCELFEVLEHIKYEIEQYLFHDKCAFKQQELPFDSSLDATNADEVEEAETEKKPKSKRGRKPLRKAS